MPVYARCRWQAMLDGFSGQNFRASGRYIQSAFGSARMIILSGAPAQLRLQLRI
jgi:hypothetical protein